MLFSIGMKALNGDEATLNCLDAIVDRVEDAVHELEIVDADLLSNSSWYQSSRHGRRKFLEEVAANALRKAAKVKGPHLRKIVVDDATSAERAKQQAQTPLHILLENADSDGALIEASLTAFASAETLTLFKGRPSKLAIPAIKIESRGGHGELKKLVESQIADSIAHTKPLRCIVVTDSDGEYIGEIKDHAIGIRNLCIDAGIPCPPLNKRTAENYIPDEIWNAWSSGLENLARKPMVEALQRLTPAQRDHIHMDNGNKPPWNKNNPLSHNLFSSVSDADYDLLTNSILKGRGKGMAIHAMNSYPTALNAASLNNRDPNGDLAVIVAKIEEEL